MRKSPASSTSPADRKSCRKATPSFANSIAGTSPSFSSMRGSNSRASARPCSATPPVFHHAAERPRRPRRHGQDIALPEVTQHAIMNYPLPDHQTGQKYSPFTYLHTDATRNMCGTVHNVSSAGNALLQFVRAASISTAAPASFARARASSRASSITPIVRPKTNPHPLTPEKTTLQFYASNILCRCSRSSALFAGCAATRPSADTALGAGGAYLGHELSTAILATAAGAAGGVILSEGLHFAAKNNPTRLTPPVTTKGKSDAVKQQYWLYVAMQQQRRNQVANVRLYPVKLPEQRIDGVTFQPSTKLLRIEE